VLGADPQRYRGSVRSYGGENLAHNILQPSENVRSLAHGRVAHVLERWASKIRDVVRITRLSREVVEEPVG
jgi:hypothetical protein